MCFTLQSYPGVSLKVLAFTCLCRIFAVTKDSTRDTLTRAELYYIRTYTYIQETTTYKCMGERSLVVCLEALPVDNGGAGLIVLLLADPHLLEGGQGSQDGATDPDGVLPLRWGNDLDDKLTPFKFN